MCLYGIWLLFGHVYVMIVFTSVQVSEDSSFLLYLCLRVWEVVYNICAILTIVIIWSERKKFIEILQRISSSLSGTDRRYLFRLSLFMFLHKLLFVLLFRGYFFLAIAMKEINLVWIHSLDKSFPIITHAFTIQHNWENVVMSLFITMVRAIHLAEDNVFRSLEQNLGKISPKILYKQLHRLLQVKKHFVKCISILPFLLFSYLFIGSICSIVRLKALVSDSSVASEQKMYCIVSATRVCVTVIEVAIFATYTNYLCSRTKSKLEQIQYNISLNEDRLQTIVVMKMIDDSKEFQYRAADFFVINRELLISFSAAFVTFTVLFVQLINQSQ